MRFVSSFFCYLLMDICIFHVLSMKQFYQFSFLVGTGMFPLVYFEYVQYDFHVRLLIGKHTIEIQCEHVSLGVIKLVVRIMLDFFIMLVSLIFNLVSCLT